MLIKEPEIVPACRCQQTFGLDAAYLAFAAIAGFESIGLLFIYLCLNRPQAETKYWAFAPLVLSLTGQCLMISSAEISLGLLAGGLALQGISIPFGMGITASLFHEIVGSEPPSYFSIMYMILELLGCIIGPFWAIQAYQVKCELCFSLIGFCVAFAIVMMGLSIKGLLDIDKVKTDPKVINKIDHSMSFREGQDADSSRTGGKRLSERNETEMKDFKAKLN